MPSKGKSAVAVPANFRDYYNSLTKEQQDKLATDAGTSTDYLYQLATSRRGAGTDIIKRLMKADEKITFEMMSS